MEQQDKIRLLLSMQEHPEQYTDEQLHQMIANDPELAEQLEQLALTKQAFVKHEADEETVPVDEEWQKFAAEHADELEALTAKAAADSSLFLRPSEQASPIVAEHTLHSSLRKLAASIIGVLLMSGMAFAAIHIVRHVVRGDLKSPTQEVRISNPSQPFPALPTDTIKTDTTTNTKPVVFDNVPLDKMLPRIAAHYSIGDSKTPIAVEFQNVDARQLRFYFVWKQDEPLDVVLHRLNLFESITLELRSDKIVVE